jgi:hypothetical protein
MELEKIYYEDVDAIFMTYIMNNPFEINHRKLLAEMLL